MARPRKQTVDYFPHDCDASEGRTLTILQSKYGNDGYSFWFKLLQLLGKSQGHFYDYNVKADWEFLLARTFVSEDTANSILSTLADLGAIDRELYAKKIIWCQHFVDNIADVYKRRSVDVPRRPGPPLPESAFSLTLVTEHDTVKADKLKIAGMISYYEKELGKTLTPTDYDKVVDFADQYPDGWFEKAVDEAKNNKAKSPMRYIEKILESQREKEEPPEPSTDNQGIQTI